MTSLSRDDVRHIAKLCRLSLSDAEVTKYSKELTSILAFVEKLTEVDTTNVEPTPQATGLSNVFREDRLTQEDSTDAAVLLACSPLPILDHQIQTPSAHG